MADAWDFLTRTPVDRSSTNDRLKGDLATVTHVGRTHEQWQHDLHGGARLWFYVAGQEVVLVEVHTRHPNQTK